MKSEYKKYIWGTVLASLINSYANMLAGALQMHYMITFVPLMCIYSGLFIKLCDKIPIKYNWKALSIAVVVFVTSLMPYKTYIEKICRRSKNVVGNAYATMIQLYIEETTEPEDLVQFIGGREESVQTNYKTKRLSASKYSYLPLWPTFTKERKVEIINEVVEEVKENKPKLIIMCDYVNKRSDPVSDKDEFYDLIEDKEEWNKFLEENYIEPLIMYNYFIIYNRKY